MKAIKFPPAALLIARANSGNGSRTNFFIRLILVINIISQLAAFGIYKRSYQPDVPAIGHLFLFCFTVFSSGLLVLLIIKWHRDLKRNAHHQKKVLEKTMFQLETKALNAQMNPHFIFNCMNSVKLLIQQKEESKAIVYLTAISKLLRTILQNSDEKEITLFEEIETCRLYTQLEGMRFGSRFSYGFDIDETIDLKSFRVPALILQPFIENAIWHGIMPKEEGSVNVIIKKNGEAIYCIIDDNGIGREMSKQNKLKGIKLNHQSKGLHLTQSRLNFDSLMNERNASLEIFDKIEEGKPAGTTVVLTFKEY